MVKGRVRVKGNVDFVLLAVSGPASIITRTNEWSVSM